MKSKILSVRVYDNLYDNILTEKLESETISDYVIRKLDCHTLSTDMTKICMTLLNFFDFIVNKIVTSQNRELISDMSVYIRDIAPEIDKAKEMIKNE